MPVGSVAVEEALLVLKIAFLVLLYLFIWRIVRSAARDVRLPQESFVLAPGSVPGLGPDAARVESGRLVVVKSPPGLLGIQPTDDCAKNPSHSSDHAATPEAYRAFLLKGARGGGGSDYTGGHSGSKSGAAALQLLCP